MTAVEQKAGGRSYWLDLFTGATWQEFLAAGGDVSGFRESRWKTMQRLKPGDYLLCSLEASGWCGSMFGRADSCNFFSRGSPGLRNSPRGWEPSTRTWPSLHRPGLRRDGGGPMPKQGTTADYR
jgi:hypothetical protein